MTNTTPLSLPTALSTVITRLEGAMETDCECDNTHEANHTVCGLCQYRQALEHDRQSEDAFLVVIEDAQQGIVWGHGYPLSRFDTAKAAAREGLRDGAVYLGRQHPDGQPDTSDLSVIYIAEGNVRIDEVFTRRDLPPYT